MIVWKNKKQITNNLQGLVHLASMDGAYTWWFAGEIIRGVKFEHGLVEQSLFVEHILAKDHPRNVKSCSFQELQ